MVKTAILLIWLGYQISRLQFIGHKIANSIEILCNSYQRDVKENYKFNTLKLKEDPSHAFLIQTTQLITCIRLHLKSGKHEIVKIMKSYI